MMRPSLAHAPQGDLWVELSVNRLRNRYNPFTVIQAPDDLDLYAGIEPEEYRPGDDRGSAYAMARIAHHMRYGWPDPICVDWTWSYGFPERLVVVDGHHRFCAAILLRESHIVVSYSGPLSELAKLQ